MVAYETEEDRKAILVAECDLASEILNNAINHPSFDDNILLLMRPEDAGIVSSCMGRIYSENELAIILKNKAVDELEAGKILSDIAFRMR